MIGDVLPENTRAEGRSRGVEQIEVLQQKRHAGEGAIGKPTIDLPPGVVVMLHDHRVDLGVDFGGALSPRPATLSR